MDRKPPGTEVHIFSGNLSGQQTIHLPRTTHPLVPKIKHKLKSLLYTTKLSHVSAHKGTFDTVYVDKLEKQATTHANIEHDLSLSSPSSIKRVFKSRIISKWQEYWDYTDKGRHSYELIPKVTLDLDLLTPIPQAFL